MADILDLLGLDPMTGLPRKKKTSQPSPVTGFTSAPSGAGGFSGATGMGAVGDPLFQPQGAKPISGGLPYKSLQDFLGDPDAMRKAIESDPTYGQFIKGLGTATVEDASSRDAAMRRALIDYGVIPDFSGPQFQGLPTDLLNGLITDDVRNAASKFTGLGYSTVGQLNTARQRQQEDLTRALGEGRLTTGNQLAARGINAKGGEYKYQMQRLQEDYDRTNQRGQQDFEGAQFQGTRQLVDYLQGYQSAFLAAERAREEARQRVAGEAARRQAEFMALMYGNQGDEYAPAPAQAAPAPAPANPNYNPRPQPMMPGFTAPVAKPKPKPKPAPKKANFSGRPGPG
jgi:hypothetical protein